MGLIAKEPTIDGDLSDRCWASAMHVSGFYRFGDTSAVADQTEAWVCAGKRGFYIAFHCIDTHPESIRAFETQRDGDLSKDDRVGIEIDTSNAHRAYSRFVVSANGVQSETIEGGTADNITWSGDWKAAARRLPNGWTAEMYIPYALLKYPHGSRSLSVLLFRRVARETTRTVWPYIPRNIQDSSLDPQHMQEFTGLILPTYAPHPIILPYVRYSTLQGEGAQAGVDLKYPISTSLTGVATYKPDFLTIEQDVTDVNFSYTEKILDDRRPFFAEGASFLPNSEFFYSRRVENVDAGLKVVGKAGPYQIGVLGTAATGQQAEIVNLSREIGLLSSVDASFVQGNTQGQATSTIGRIGGSYGWLHGARNYFSDVRHTSSWVDNQQRGGRFSADVGVEPGNGHPGFFAYYDQIAPDYTNNLGYIPETNLKGGSIDLAQSNQFSKGNLEQYYVSLDLDSWQYMTGGFFHGSQSFSADWYYRSGVGLHLGANLNKRIEDDGTIFRDHVNERGMSWGRKTLLRRGRLEYDSGTQAGQAYQFTSISQGAQFSDRLSAKFQVDRLVLGSDTTTQTVLTGSYHLDPYRSVGGRMLSQDHERNFYVSYGQRMRTGDDIFVIVGDPNAVNTATGVTVKITHAI